MDTQYSFKQLINLLALKIALLETIQMQRREYEPVENTPCWGDAWFSSDMREVEAWSHRHIQPKSITMNY